MPSDASPADAAVLLTAFRANLAEARAATDADLDKLLTDAVAFFDEVLLRAALTALVERDGGRERARTWWRQITDVELLDNAKINSQVDGSVSCQLKVNCQFGCRSGGPQRAGDRSAYGPAGHAR